MRTARPFPLRKRRAALAVAVVPLLVAGCKRLGSVEGDLTMGEGGAQKGAYLTVALVRNTGDSVSNAIDALCSAVRADVQQQGANIQQLQARAERYRGMHGRTMLADVALSDSVQKYRDAIEEAQRNLNERPDTTSPKIQAIIQAATDTQVDADKDGHFRIPGRKPGKYLLYAVWPTNGDELRFMAPVELIPGKVSKQLDQTTEATARLGCR